MGATATAADRGEMTVALEWVSGGDTGLSSMTIWRAMVGTPEPSFGFEGGAYPEDPADFGRCRRLLQRIPSWRGRLHEIPARLGDGRHGRVWAALIAAWDELDALWEDEVESQPPGRGRMAPRLYERMRAIIDPIAYPSRSTT